MLLKATIDCAVDNKENGCAIAVDCVIAVDCISHVSGKLKKE